MYVAVMNPIFYSTRLRFWHCTAIGWGLSVLASIIGVSLHWIEYYCLQYYIQTTVGLGGSALFFPSESFFACPVDSCQVFLTTFFRSTWFQFPFGVSILSVIGVSYLLMLICYSTVILKLRKRIDKIVCLKYSTKISDFRLYFLYDFHSA